MLSMFVFLLCSLSAECHNSGQLVVLGCTSKVWRAATATLAVRVTLAALGHHRLLLLLLESAWVHTQLERKLDVPISALKCLNALLLWEAHLHQCLHVCGKLLLLLLMIHFSSEH